MAAELTGRALPEIQESGFPGCFAFDSTRAERSTGLMQDTCFIYFGQVNIRREVVNKPVDPMHLPRPRRFI
ncbi:MAG: hypothetical protein JWQ14_1653 [Adhaeribacter sp.]|jgi:hypothetical protein|nr:hypothetical protein [Adhaeribacter sp.]